MAVELGNFETKPHSKDLHFVRRLKAPRAKVFEVLTQPKHLVHFWAPKPFTMPKCEVDLRVGGKWNYVFRSPEGMTHDCEEIYVQVEPPAKLATEGSVPGPNGKPFFTIRKSFQLIDKGDETEMILDMKVLQVNPGGEPFMEGAPKGFEMTLSNLDEYLQKQ